MTKAIEATTDTATNAEFVTDPLPATASRKRAWAWAVFICGSAVAATLWFYPPSALFSHSDVEVTKLTQAVTPANEFTVFPGGTIAVVPEDEENSGWRVLLVPEHGQTTTIYYGEQERAARIYTLADAVQRKVTETGRPQRFVVSKNGNVAAINKPFKN
jgi:hypothetical protein